MMKYVRMRVAISVTSPRPNTELFLLGADLYFSLFVYSLQMFDVRSSILHHLMNCKLLECISVVVILFGSVFCLLCWN